MFKPGDVVITTIDLPHPTRCTLPAGTTGTVTRAYPNGLLAVDVEPFCEFSPRAIRAAAVRLVERPARPAVPLALLHRYQIEDF